MDWSKAKTILIVAFLVTNILLGTVLYFSGKKAETVVSEDFIQDVIKLLKSKNISLNTEIPKSAPGLNNIVVEYEELEANNINEKFFKGKGKITNLKSGNTEIIHEHERIIIENNKKLTYVNNNRKRRYIKLNDEEAIDLSLSFLRDRGYDTKDMKLYYINKEKDIYRLKFSKLYNDKYLENTNTSIVLDNGEVKEVERTWLKVLEEGEKQIYITVAPKSILSLLSMKEAYGRNIVDMSQCYYFDLKEFEDAKKGKAGPAWRILFEDGYKIIIDSY